MLLHVKPSNWWKKSSLRKLVVFYMYNCRDVLLMIAFVSLHGSFLTVSVKVKHLYKCSETDATYNESNYSDVCINIFKSKVGNKVGN